MVVADQPDAPQYFAFDAILNTRERVTLDSKLERVLHPVAPDEVIRQRRGRAGADVRDATEFAQGHLAGSINIGLGGQYATWAGTVLDRAKPILIVAEPGREQEAALRLGRIGFDHVWGYLDGAWQPQQRGQIWFGPPNVSASATIAEELASLEPPILDIRNPREWEAGHIPESLNIPLNHIQERLEEVL